MQTIKLNLIPGSVLPVVNVSQYDANRQFQLVVYEGATAYSLSGKSVQIRGTKPDGNGFAYDATDGVVSVSGSTVTISTTQQMTAVGGHVMAELRIESGTTVIGTLNFIIDVEPSALSDDTIISDTEIPVIERDFEAALTEAEADALVAEGYAKGTQDGVPVGSGSPYYHDNAKHYKEEAEAAASGVLEKYPKIVADYWYIWDVDTEQYVNTGVRAKGTQGDPGEGVPAGGTTGQVLRKKSDDNYDTEWANGGGGASALDDLTDVDITTPASGDGLLYDGSKWVNGAVATPTQLAAKLDVTAQQQLGAWNLGENRGITQTINGATFTKNADDTVTVNIAGDAVTAYAEYLFVPEGTLLPDRLERGETYYLSGCTGGGFNPNTFYVFIVFRDSSNHSAGSVVCTDGYTQFTVPLNAHSYRWGIAIFQAAGKLTGQVFSPMISLKPNMPYVPYAMTNRELTGLCYDVDTISGVGIGNILTDSTLSEQTSYSWFQKVGRLVIGYIRFKTSYTSIGTSKTIGTLPSGYKPLMQSNFQTFNGEGVSTSQEIHDIYFNTTGSIALTLRNSHNANTKIMANFMYFV